MEDIQGAWLASGMGIFFGWAFLAWLVRVWAKVRTKAWTLDDYAISGSVGLYLGQLFYILSFGLCRVAAALFIAYISHSGPHIKPARVVAVITAAWTVASALAVCIRGDIIQPWVVLDGSSSMFIRWLGIEITGILIELALWGIAAHLVWGIQLKVSKRIMIVCAFGARLLVVPCLVARLVFLDPRINTGPTRSATMADLLTEVCVHLSIIAGSVTALKPLLTSFYVTHPAPLELTTSTSRLRSKDRSGGGDAYYRLETVKPAVLSGGAGERVVINRATVSDIMWQTAQGLSHQASAYSKSDNTRSASRSIINSRTDDGSGKRRKSALTGPLKGRRARERGPSVSSGSEGSGRMIIQKTTEVTVQYK
ncbi:hypothetical protein LEL_04013 [Akanthomyces lecanii RCEF 1005]|uniref:Integral membrane protein n=1 Tax=Akanthomyces lecanii RCEF 1005 TaxID=1081108 RepID=A0A168H1D5_CORDF|nr:hypothetical protein LEL_04013 [Akanthomyces lecanii RCEF 1005]